MKYELAIVHDYLTSVGGAEMTVKAMGEVWPTSPIYTLLYDKKQIGPDFLKNTIRPSFLKKMSWLVKRNKKFSLPFFMVAPETFDLREFEVVLSSSGAFSKGVITKPNTINICYCHSPMRFAWDYTHDYLKELSLGKVWNFSARLILNYVRLWDAVSSDRVDYYIANSHATKEKIKKYYRRNSTVIYPPVEVDLFRTNENKKNKRDFFLIVSRLSAYKKIDIAVEAFNKLGWNLIVIGTGSELKHLRKIAGPTVKILGAKSREETIRYFKACKAFILPGEEDFGISAVEAMAAEKPVLALRAGGALETIIEGATGEFFDASTVEVLAEGAYRLKEKIRSYDPRKIREQAKRFSKERFQREIKQFVEEKYQEFSKQTN